MIGWSLSLTASALSSPQFPQVPFSDTFGDNPGNIFLFFGIFVKWSPKRLMSVRVTAHCTRGPIIMSGYVRATFFLSFFVTSNPTCSKLTCTESAAEVKTLGGGAICVLAHPHHPLIDLPESWARPGGPVRDVPRRFVSWQNAADDYGLHALHPNSVEGESVEL